MPKRGQGPYSTTDLPNFVWEFLGTPRDLTLHRFGANWWVFTGARRMLFVKADSATGARYAAREAVSRLAPRTDRRRCYWEYT